MTGLDYAILAALQAGWIGWPVVRPLSAQQPFDPVGKMWRPGPSPGFRLTCTRLSRVCGWQIVAVCLKRLFDYRRMIALEPLRGPRSQPRVNWLCETAILIRLRKVGLDQCLWSLFLSIP
jgi:hypothetical protein